MKFSPIITIFMFCAINAPAARERAEAPGTLHVREQRGLQNLDVFFLRAKFSILIRGDLCFSLTETTELNRSKNFSFSSLFRRDLLKGELRKDQARSNRSRKTTNCLEKQVPVNWQLASFCQLTGLCLILTDVYQLYRTIYS